MLIFCATDPNKEPRLIRTVEALSATYEVTVCAYEKFNETTFFDMHQFLQKRNVVTFHLNYPVLFRKAISAILDLFYYKRSDNTLNPLFNTAQAVAELNKLEPGVLICHGLGFLELCSRLKNKETKLVLNAHEYYPAEFEDKPEWKEQGENYKKALNSCGPKIDLMFAVNETIGSRYKKEFGIPYIEVVNATDYEADLSPHMVKSPVKIVHHGVALKNRKIELMIEAVLKSSLACELHLILVPTEKEYFESLRTRYGSEKKIIFSDPVNVKDIARHINRFDIGLFYLEPVNYNWKHALPNKLFEFVQARLAVIVSPNPDMKKMVEQYGLGWVTKDFSLDSLVETLNGVSENEISGYKSNSHQNAKELSAIKVKQTMLNAVDHLCAA